MNWYQRKIGRKLRSFKKNSKNEASTEKTHEVITFENSVIPEPKMENLVQDLPVVEPLVRPSSDYFLPSTKLTGSRCVLSSSAGE